MTFTERTLQIDIADAISGRKFDGADHGLTSMKAVDFIVELEDRYLFIELKDPDDPEAAPERRGRFLERLRSGGLDESLKYKYRDSFLYEWASGRADKPIDYFVLIALDSLEDGHLLTRTEALQRKLPKRGPSGRPWQREIVRGCGVFNVESWNRRFPLHPVSRVSAADHDDRTAP